MILCCEKNYEPPKYAFDKFREDSELGKKFVERVGVFVLKK